MIIADTTEFNPPNNSRQVAHFLINFHNKCSFKSLRRDKNCSIKFFISLREFDVINLNKL